MALTVRETFEQYSELDVDDKNLGKRILAFLQYFINKNENHSDFFGGNLLGFPKVAWTKAEDRMWLEGVCKIDDMRNCQIDLYECEHIYRERKVTSNIFNLSIPWVLNVLYRQDKKNGKGTPSVEAALIVGMIRHLTAFMHKRFEYGSNPEIALSMFEKLDNKSDFKRTGSWVDLMRLRTDIFLNTEGRYPDVWQEMVNDERTVRMCQEVNGNLRTTVNILTEKYYIEKDLHDRIRSKSKIGQLDGEEVIKDYIRKTDKLRDDMNRVCRQPSALIKNEVIEATLEIVTTCKEEHLRETLLTMADNYNSNDGWNEMVEELVLFILDLRRTRACDFSSVYQVVNHVRSLFRSSSTTNKHVLSIKKKLLRLVKESNPKVREAKLASISGGVSTYLVIRLLAIDFYK